MKKILLILMVFASLATYAQAEFPESVQLTNQTSTTATKVNVQESNGVVNTIAKADLIEVLEYASAINLPVTGVSGKIYVTIDSGRLYRWNGTVYNEISAGGVTSVSGLNGVTVTNPTTTPIIGLGDITPTTVTTNSTTLTPVTAPSYAEGKVFYDSTAKTLVAYDDISGTSTNLGQELNLRARNNTGVTIVNGSVVYISGATGQNPTIALARANSLSTSVTIGIATHDILNNTVGKITTFGLVNELNTSAFTDGQVLYLSPTTAGVLTSIVPSSPNYTAYVCVVLHSHVTQGKIFVRPEQPISLNTALTDNNNTSPSVSAVKSYVDTGLVSKISGSGTINSIPKFTATGTVGNSQIVDDGADVIVGGGVTGGKLTVLGGAGANSAVYIRKTDQQNGRYGLTIEGGSFNEAWINFKAALTIFRADGGIIYDAGVGNSFSFRKVGSGGSTPMTISTANNLLIKTISDNGVDAIQTPGTVSFAAATLANQGVIKSQLDLKANIASPTFTGVPTVPTATAGTNTTQIASTAFVSSAVNTSSNWTKTGDDIQNNNIMAVKITNKLLVGGSTTASFPFPFTLGITGKTASSEGFRGSVLADLNEYKMISGSSGNTYLSSYGGVGVTLNSEGNINDTETGNAYSLSAPISFSPNSGTRNYSALNVNPTINQTGGANGITRGLYVNPTLTSAADFRAIEITAGKVIIPNGNANNEAVNRGQVAQQLKDHFTDSNNVGITETDLFTYSTPASRLNAAGEKIISVYAGTMNDVTASSQLKAYFAGTLIADTGALTMSVTGAWVINASIIRTGANTARSIVNISTPGASTASYTKYTSLTGLTFTNTNIIKITGTASGATGGDNDITATYGNILWQPAAL